MVAGDITDPFVVVRALAGCEVVFHPAALIAIPYF
jgi:nucleoside-diphosphate-sugar epimerase